MGGDYQKLNASIYGRLLRLLMELVIGIVRMIIESSTVVSWWPGGMEK